MRGDEGGVGVRGGEGGVRVQSREVRGEVGIRGKLSGKVGVRSRDRRGCGVASSGES